MTGLKYVTDNSTDSAVELPKAAVNFLKFDNVETVEPDDFRRPAAEIREKAAGLSSNFKRKLTNELKKAYTGDGGAASKKIEEEAELLGYDALDVVIPPYNLSYLTKLYEVSAPHHAAVDAKVANIVGLGYSLVETNETKRLFENTKSDTATDKARKKLTAHRDEMSDTLDKFNKEDSLDEIFIKVWRDYEVTGNGYLEVGRKKDGTIGYLGHIPAQTMRIRRQRDGFVQVTGYKVQFFANFGAGVDDKGKKKAIANPVGGGTPNEVVHIKRYSPTSGFYGIPDIVAAQQALAGNEFIARFNLDYFENKAVPRHVITLKGATLGSEYQRNLLEFFETNLKGQNHRSLFVPLPGDTQDSKVEFDIKPVEVGIQDASFINYRKANIDDILMVHRVPLSKISSADVNLATAADADKTFKEQVCGPEQRIFQKKVNLIIKELTTALELVFNEMTLTSEDIQSQIDDRNVGNGTVTRNEVRAKRGHPAVAGGDEPVDPTAKDKIAEKAANDNAERQRDKDRVANASDSKSAPRNPKGAGRQQE